MTLKGVVIIILCHFTECVSAFCHYYKYYSYYCTLPMFLYTYGIRSSRCMVTQLFVPKHNASVKKCSDLSPNSKTNDVWFPTSLKSMLTSWVSICLFCSFYHHWCENIFTGRIRQSRWIQLLSTWFRRQRPGEQQEHWLYRALDVASAKIKR